MRQFHISDLHLGHARIIEYANRPFASVREMNDAIIMRWNNTVNRDAIVYLHGDIAFGPSVELVKELNGRIRLIMGNHDTKNYRYYLNLFDRVYDVPIVRTWGGMTFLLSHEPQIECNLINIHGHTHEKELGKGYWNVCCEKTNYTPVDIVDLIRKKG